MRIDEICAVVTGASGGIGAPLCRRLVAGGARVVLVGRDPVRLGALATELSASPGRGAPLRAMDRDRVDLVAVDLGTAAGRRAVRAAAEQHGANVLIHGAAVPAFGALEDIDDATLEAMLRTDLLAPIALTRDLLPLLRAAPRAAVLAIGSMVGEIGLPGFAAYGAAKGGLRAFCEALRRELADSPVRVQYLAARATRTGFNDARADGYNARTRTTTDPPERVADAVVDMLRSGRTVRHLGMPERLFVRVNALVPTWIDGGFDRHRDALAACGKVPTLADVRPAATASAPSPSPPPPNQPTKAMP